MPAMISAKGFGPDGDDKKVVALFHRVDELFYPTERAADNKMLKKAGNAYVEPAQEGKGMLSAESDGMIGVFGYFASLALLTSGNDKSAIERTWDQKQKELLPYVSTDGITRELDAWNASVDELNRKLKQRFGDGKAPELTRVERGEPPSGPTRKQLIKAFDAMLGRELALGQAYIKFDAVADDYGLEGDEIDDLAGAFTVDLASIQGKDRRDILGKQREAIIAAIEYVTRKVDEMIGQAEASGENEKADALSEILVPLD